MLHHFSEHHDYFITKDKLLTPSVIVSCSCSIVKSVCMCCVGGPPISITYASDELVVLQNKQGFAYFSPSKCVRRWWQSSFLKLYWIALVTCPTCQACSIEYLWIGSRVKSKVNYRVSGLINSSCIFRTKVSRVYDSLLQEICSKKGYTYSSYNIINLSNFYQSCMQVTTNST